MTRSKIEKWDGDLDKKVMDATSVLQPVAGSFQMTEGDPTVKRDAGRTHTAETAQEGGIC
jgi:hypothetical protein